MAPLTASELIPDPDFDDAAAWYFVGFGATVTGGQLRFINSSVGSSDTVPHIGAVVGRQYNWSLRVATYPGSPTTLRVLFGGVEIYNKDGVGPFSGTITAIDTSGLVFISIMGGQWFIDSVSITEN